MIESNWSRRPAKTSLRSDPRTPTFFARSLAIRRTSLLLRSDCSPWTITLKLSPGAALAAWISALSTAGSAACAGVTPPASNVNAPHAATTTVAIANRRFDGPPDTPNTSLSSVCCLLIQFSPMIL